jgi:hypothetical protein
MVSAARAGPLLVAGPLCASLLGCSGLLDLGPEATLRDAGVGNTMDATPAPEAGSVLDAGAQGDALYQCGLAPAPNEACNNCSDQFCCDYGIQCSHSARCTEGMQKLLDCVYDPTCVEQVQEEYGDSGTRDFQSCVLHQCTTDCLPGPSCALLAGCCREIDKTSQFSAWEVCVGAVNALDESKCVTILDSVLRPRLGPTFCGGMAPADGGHD